MKMLTSLILCLVLRGFLIEMVPESRAVNQPMATPSYESYSVQTNPISHFAKTQIPKSGINWKMWRYLRFSDSEPVNFAGKYTLLEISCGTGCVEYCLIDRTTGTVFPEADFNQDFPDDYHGLTGLHYRSNSRLLVVYHATAFEYPVSVEYYVWEGNKFHFLHRDRVQSPHDPNMQ